MAGLGTSGVEPSGCEGRRWMQVDKNRLGNIVMIDLLALHAAQEHLNFMALPFT
jgi:hypothetical protein